MSGTDNYTLTPHYSYIKPISLADDDLWGDHINLNWDSLDAKLYQIEFNGNYLPLAGGIMRGGISFGTMIGGSSTDLTKHISLYGGNTGFSVSGGGRLNYNTPSGFSHYFVCAGADVMQLNGSGLAVNANLSVTNTASFGTTASPAQMNFGNNTATSAAFWIAGAVGAGRQIVWTSAGARRWIIGMGAGTEPGSNGGGDWFLQRWADDGTTSLGNAVLVTRSTGAVTLSGALTAPGTVTTGNLSAGPLGAVNSYSTFGNATTPNNQLSLNGAAGVNRGLMWMSATVSRWQFVVNGAEGGANAGGNMNLIRYDDSGTNIGNSLTFTRSTGLGTVAGDPTAALGIATKGYVDSLAAGGPFLRLVGGTLAGPGNLTVSGTLAAGGALGTAGGGLQVDARGNVGISMAPPAGQAIGGSLSGVTGGWLFGWGATLNNWANNAYYDGAGWRYLAAAEAWNQLMSGASVLWQHAPAGAAGAVAAMTTAMTLTGAGALTVAGTITGSGGVLVNGSVAAGGFGLYPWGGVYYLAFATNWALSWNTSSGLLIWNSPSGGVFTIDAAGSVVAQGNLSLAGSEFVSGYARASQGYYPDASGNFRIFYDGSGVGARVLQWSPQWNWWWNVNNGQHGYATPAGTQWLFDTTSTSFNWLSYVGGVGAYVNGSDERMKVEIVDAPHGLAEILAIKPITFRRWDRMTKAPRERMELGFGARQLRAVFPDAVVTLNAPDEWKALAAEEPILGVQSEAIVAALVNAIKTLNTRLAALEQRTLH